jgi:hypothetical protein
MRVEHFWRERIFSVGKGEAAWEKAVACERHAQATTDNKLQTAFRKLRDSWVVGNNAEFAEHVDANNQRLKDERESQQ